MKKVFFTAIAMIAFSSASMANTIADEEVVKENHKNKEIEAKITQTDPSTCLALKLFYYSYGISIGMTHQQASGAAHSVYFNCMSQVLEEISADGIKH